MSTIPQNVDDKAHTVQRDRGEHSIPNPQSMKLYDLISSDNLVLNAKIAQLLTLNTLLLGLLGFVSGQGNRSLQFCTIIFGLSFTVLWLASLQRTLQYRDWFVSRVKKLPSEYQLYPDSEQAKTHFKWGGSMKTNTTIILMTFGFFAMWSFLAWKTLEFSETGPTQTAQLEKAVSALNRAAISLEKIAALKQSSSQSGQKETVAVETAISTNALRLQAVDIITNTVTNGPPVTNGVRANNVLD